MSNIPSSAIPHAWAKEDAEAAAGKGEEAQAGPSLAMLAGLGALAGYVLYRIVR